MQIRFLVIILAVLSLLSSCEEKVSQISREAKTVLLVADSMRIEATEMNGLVSSLETETVSMYASLVIRYDDEILHDDSLEQVSAILLCRQDLSELSVKAKASLERYLQMGGGVVSIGSICEKPLSWPFWQTLNSSSSSEGNGLITPVADVESPQAESPSQSYNLQYADVRSQNWAEILTTAIGTNSFIPSKATTPAAPEDSRFTIKVLDSVMIEPMELTILPDGKVIYIERRGKMKMYLPEESRTVVLHEFDVCTSGNYEDGLLGLTIDPAFSENGYLYLYYSPGSECEKAQHLSRFTMKDDSLILASEKLILRVPVQRETCCHSGGSLTWDADGNLYLSTGDNTSSKESDGYSPLDERPGRGPFDSQKSSGNTNDLRGKILRIKPNEYARYTIPEGNLFARDGSQGRPEIYVMGARNPFRISVDQKTGFLYWGDVGPDVGVPGKYGPESYDEWNQARSAGNYGWPYFVGDNFAYRSRDFATDTVGEFYNPAIPVNNSPNNTGVAVLPPARPAYIWYPKGPSEQFPQVGVGSNSAMAGPVYYSDLYPDSSDVRFPEYFDGKWFMYEWARSWIQVATFNESGDLAGIEPFLPEWKISKPIDLEFGPDGAMYLLEYGQNYFADNPDARLVRIEYAAGNREPVARASANKLAGGVPLEVSFDAGASFDYDEEDSLTYTWTFSDGQTGAGEKLAHTFTDPGIYSAIVTVTDTSGASSTAELELKVGNSIPEVSVGWAGNRSFILSSGVSYQTTVSDPEDQATGGIRRSETSLQAVYLPDLALLENMSVSEALDQGSFTFQQGKDLIDNSDCATCHAMDIKSVGPSYYDIADRYRNQYDMEGYLASKIITGGNGNWGGKIMAGHPQLNIDQTTKMVRYILSLEKGKTYGELPLQGTFRLRDHESAEGGAYLVRASYTDKGNGELPPQTGQELLILREGKVQAEDFDEGYGVFNLVTGPDRDIDVVAGLWEDHWLSFSQWDLTGLTEIEVVMASGRGGVLSIRTGSPDGEEIGAVRISPAADPQALRSYRIPLRPASGMQDIYFVPGNEETGLGAIDFIRVSGSQPR